MGISQTWYRLPWVRRRQIRWAIALTAGALGFLLAMSGQVKPPQHPVVVADGDLPAGSMIEAADLAVQAYTDQIPGSFTDPELLTGHLLLTGVASGEPITATRVLGSNETTVVGPGRRAMPIALRDAAVAGLLRPGQLVDILWAPGSGLSGEAAHIVAEGARVLSVPEDAAGTSSTFGAAPQQDGELVLFEINEADAIGLAAAQASGVLSAVLRGE